MFFIGVFIVAFLGLLGTPASAQEPIKTCAGVEVQSITTSIQSENLDTANKVKIVLTQASTATVGTGKRVTVIAIGPILDVMDSSEVKTDLACTAEGIVLTATITRSANYRGSVLANVSWRPRIEATILLYQPEIILEARWIMRLTTGALVEQVEDRSFPGQQKYPIIVKQTIR